MLSSINRDSHLHLSGFSPLRKIPTVNHYLRNQDFQHSPQSRPRVIIKQLLYSIIFTVAVATGMVIFFSSLF